MFFNLRYIWWVICWPTILSDSLIFRGFRYLQMFSNRKVLYFFYIIRYNYTSFPDICLYAIPWCRTVPIRIKDAMVSDICDIVVYIAVTKLNKNPKIVGLHVVKKEKAKINYKVAFTKDHYVHVLNVLSLYFK